jgi:four helix bundle protein
MDDRFISAADSFGANIAERYGRYHYLDKIRFFYNARVLLAEAREHWLELLKERKEVSEEMYNEYESVAKQAQIKLQSFIFTI